MHQVIGTRNVFVDTSIKVERNSVGRHPAFGARNLVRSSDAAIRRGSEVLRSRQCVRVILKAAVPGVIVEVMRPSRGVCVVCQEPQALVLKDSFTTIWRGHRLEVTVRQGE